jgi:hypothetical protein
MIYVISFDQVIIKLCSTLAIYNSIYKFRLLPLHGMRASFYFFCILHVADTQPNLYIFLYLASFRTQLFVVSHITSDTLVSETEYYSCM